MEVFWVGMGVLIALVAWMWVRSSQRQSEIASELAASEAFAASETFTHETGGLAYDASRRLLKIANRNQGGIRSTILGAGDIVEVKLYDTGTVVAQTGGGLLGGVAGGVGLGFVGARRHTMSVSVGLQIVTRDRDNPSWDICIAEMHEAKSNLAEVTRSAGLKTGRHWYGIVASLVDSYKAEVSRPTTEAEDLAGQIRELVQLREAGILSPDEFQAAKERLLRE